MNDEVNIYTYVVERTFDAYSYQIVENKQKFISQIMTSKEPSRVMEDVDDSVLNFAEIKALASGNPLILTKLNLENEIRDLKLAEKSFISNKYRLQDSLATKYPDSIKSNTDKLNRFKDDLQVALGTTPSNKDEFNGMVVYGQSYVDKKAAGSALLVAIADSRKTPNESVSIGSYRGFEMIVKCSQGYVAMTLKAKGLHSIYLGHDVFGNIQRIDNCLDNTIAEEITSIEKEIGFVKQQIEVANVEVQKDFPKKEELTNKERELDKVNSELLIGNKKEADIENKKDNYER